MRSLRTARARVAAVHELRDGQVDIAAMPSQAIEPLTTMIRRFSDRHPGVTVAIRAAFTPRDVIDGGQPVACEDLAGHRLIVG